MAYNFHGKTALVTGASRGIGKEVTKQLVKAGAKVYALARNQGNLDVLKAEIPEVEIICVDVSNWNETKKLVEDIDDVDLLVNNAGITIPVSFGEITEESIDAIFSVNLKPVFNVSQVVVERLKKRGKPGSIVNVSSLSSMKFCPNSSIYGAGKAALDKLTRSMAIELAPFNIRVNSVNPTIVVTDMVKPFLEQPGITDYFKNDIPLQEFCNAEDIANGILFLLSEKSRMITGTILPIDGGQSAK